MCCSQTHPACATAACKHASTHSVKRPQDPPRRVSLWHVQPTPLPTHPPTHLPRAPTNPPTQYGVVVGGEAAHAHGGQVAGVAQRQGLRGVGSGEAANKQVLRKGGYTAAWGLGLRGVGSGEAADSQVVGKRGYTAACADMRFAGACTCKEQEQGINLATTVAALRCEVKARVGKY